MIVSRRSFVAGVSLTSFGLALGTSFVALAETTAAPAGYRWETHKGVGIKFALPQPWTMTQNGDVLLAKHPSFNSNGLAAEFVGAKGTAADKAEAAIIAELKKRLPDARATGPVKPANQNGLAGGVLVGAGTTTGGQKKDFLSIVMGNGKGNDLIILVIGNQGQVLSSPDVKGILDSIRLA